MDLATPALAINCPSCGLRTARFLRYCTNCGYALWPSGEVASGAFQAWRAHDPARAGARRFDLDLPLEDQTPEVDFEDLAHKLGIHLFPPSAWPFPIAAGMGILGFAAVHFDGEATGVRIALAIVGALVLLIGVVGWVLVEDVQMFPDDTQEVGHEPVAHTEAVHADAATESDR